LGRYETDDGLRLTFKDHLAVEAELQALVAVENECCGWAAWSIERGKDGALVMAARAQDDGIAAIHGMFTSATPWSRRQDRKTRDRLRCNGCHDGCLSPTHSRNGIARSSRCSRLPARSRAPTAFRSAASPSARLKRCGACSLCSASASRAPVSLDFHQPSGRQTRRG